MDIKKLGFGLMRLPTKGNDIDIEAVKEMADRFIAEGGDYFDTAYPYHEGKSEGAFKQAVADRYPRESYRLADKMPVWRIDEKADISRIFAEQLANTGVEYFDNYLIHAISDDRMDRINELDLFGFLKGLKDSGRAKHIGFSFHGTPALLKQLLESYPFVEFVQLQINYIDWEDHTSVCSSECYDIARSAGKEVIVMEPVRGGLLAKLPQKVEAEFKAADSGRSIASWAVQFASSLDGLLVMLSGMSDMEQLNDNIATVKSLKKADKAEYDVIKRAADILNSYERIPCTHCEYCVEGCPVGIKIPDVLAALNTSKMYENPEKAKQSYLFSKTEPAGSCIACGQCEGVCPQHIGIIGALAEASRLFD